MCTYTVYLDIKFYFILGTMFKEKFDHKQRDTQHKTSAKFTPTVNLYSAVKVMLTKE